MRIVIPKDEAFLHNKYITHARPLSTEKAKKIPASGQYRPMPQTKSPLFVQYSMNPSPPTGLVARKDATAALLIPTPP